MFCRHRHEGQTSLGSATDADVNMERNPKDSVVCGGKVYAKGAPVEPPMQPAEVSHPVPFQWCAACLCIICSQIQTAVSTRKSCLLMEAGCCPSTAGSLEGGSQCSPLHWQVHVWLRRPGASWVAASSMKASKAATPMVHHVGRLQHTEQAKAVSQSGTPTGTSMCHHLWSPECSRNCIAHPALHNSAWGTQHIGRSSRTIAR